MAHKNPFHEVLLNFVSKKTDRSDVCSDEIFLDECPGKKGCTPAHVTSLVGYAVLRDRWVDLGEISFNEANMEVHFDGYFPCGYCTPCEEGIPLLWDFRSNDFQIAPGMINVIHKCCCFPDDYCDPGYALLYNFETMRLRGLTICFIDEAAPLYSPDVTSTWMEDYNELIEYSGKQWHDEMIVFVPNTSSESVHPVGADLPCPVIRVPRDGSGNDLTGELLYSNMVNYFGLKQGIRDVYVYIDVSGSMNYDTIRGGIEQLYSNYSDKFNFIELQCNNERWIRWILNAEYGIQDCT